MSADPQRGHLRRLGAARIFAPSEGRWDYRDVPSKVYLDAFNDVIDTYSIHRRVWCR
jgi:hypothetical protein